MPFAAEGHEAVPNRIPGGPIHVKVTRKQAQEIIRQMDEEYERAIQEYRGWRFRGEKELQHRYLD